MHMHMHMTSTRGPSLGALEGVAVVVAAAIADVVRFAVGGAALAVVPCAISAVEKAAARVRE